MVYDQAQNPYGIKFDEMVKMVYHLSEKQVAKIYKTEREGKSKPLKEKVTAEDPDEKEEQKEEEPLKKQVNTNRLIDETE